MREMGSLLGSLVNFTMMIHEEACRFQVPIRSLGQTPSGHGGILGNSESDPAANQAQTAQRCDGPQRFEVVGIQDEGVDAAAKHGHPGSEETAGNGVSTSHKHDSGVNEL